MTWCAHNDQGSGHPGVTSPARGRRSALRAVTGGIVTLAALVSLAPAAPAASAQAEEQRTWRADLTTVCVESHVSKAWDVKGAVARWNRLDGAPTFVLRPTCSDDEGTVTVRYQRDNGIYSGNTVWYWDDAGDIVRAEVTLNPKRLKAYARGDYQCLRSWTTTHEFGHVLGLPHYETSHAGSVMSYLGWDRRCGGLSAHDRSDYRDLYA